MISVGLMTANELTLLAVGDIVLGEEDPDRFFVHAAPVLRSGDVVIAHIESTYTREGMEMPFEVPSAAGDPARPSAIPAAGFNLATIAGNHAYDQGPNGVRDTARSWPLPLHRGQVSIGVPGSAPLPLQCSQRVIAS